MMTKQGWRLLTGTAEPDMGVATPHSVRCVLGGVSEGVETGGGGEEGEKRREGRGGGGLEMDGWVGGWLHSCLQCDS